MNDQPVAAPYLLKTLEESAKRLARLIELKTPELILSNECSLIHSKAVAAFGQHYQRQLNQLEYEHARIRRGLCLKCNRGTRGSSPLCDIHQIEEPDNPERN